MNSKIAKKLRKLARKNEWKAADQFRVFTRQLRFSKRLKLAWLIVWKRF